MTKPMPSPHGTNYEGFTLPSRSPAAAYDAANGLDDGVCKKIIDYLTGKLTPEDFSSVTRILMGDTAMDEPGNFADNPREPAPDDTAMDSARRSSNGLDGVGSRRSRRANDSGAEAEFKRMFPAAGRLHL